MNSITQVQQQMLSRMDQVRSAAEEGIRPAQDIFGSQPQQGGYGAAFGGIMRAVNDQQVRAGNLSEAVVTGKSDDLVGAMVESQKASVSFTALLQVRNKITSAFEEVMRMPM